MTADCSAVRRCELREAHLHSTFKNALIAILAVTSLGGLRAQTRTNDEVAQRFVGAWRLVSWTQEMTDGTKRAAPAADMGYLIYSAGGRMCAVMQNSKRQKSPGPPSGLEEGTARSAGGVSYCAKVEVHAAEGFVLHAVEIDLNPRDIGVVRKRWFTFDGPNRLTLRIDAAERQKDVKDSLLVWERVRDE
jgi:hypothetical protein